MTLRDFLNAYASLRNFDKPDWMPPKQWRDFNADYVRFLQRAPDAVAERIWAEAQPRANVEVGG